MNLSSYHDVPELLAFLNPEVDGAFNIFLKNAPFETFQYYFTFLWKSNENFFTFIYILVRLVLFNYFLLKHYFCPMQLKRICYLF